MEKLLRDFFSAYFFYKACGKRLTDNQGRVTSPNYPNNYDDSRTCVWTITVDSSMQIRVKKDIVKETSHFYSFVNFLLKLMV